VRLGSHGLDWEIKPFPFKVYPRLEPLRLPAALPAPLMDTFAALGLPPPVARPAPLDLERLAGVLFHAAGVSRAKTYPGGGRVHFRAAPSTGALYQTEVYVVAGAVAGLAPGVYHFGPGDWSLRQLRAGDFRAALARAAADDAIAGQPASVVLSAIYWRNAWKYRERAYRHLFWDAGSMLSQLLASANALDLPARVVTGYVDAQVNALLGIDAGKEGALAIAPLGAVGAAAPASPAVAPLDPEVVPLSPREVDYPLVREAYGDSALAAEAEVLEWRGAWQPEVPFEPLADPTLTRLGPPAPEAGRTLGETIARRGSTREFSGAPISREALSSALHHATGAFPVDVAERLVACYVNVHAVTGVEPGAYVYNRSAHALVRVRAGDVRRASTFLCLEQALGGTSSATVFFLGDLEHALARGGNRGYRVANLEAGLMGGRLYLAAYALGFGATGLTFYDHAVVDFFSPHSARRAALFVTALGRSRPAGSR
jgi:SagB-type dehydrogenase family enzyme